MIIQCQGCSAKYFLPESKVPSKPVKVRCPKCRAIFRLVPPRENIVASPVDSVVASARAAVEGTLPGREEAPSAAGMGQAERPKGAGHLKGTGKDRAKRLARVLVSDILWYNKEKRDQALLDGNLMSVLGEEIKKSWELYKEKVGPEIAGSTSYFKEALNEILADGQKIF